MSFSSQNKKSLKLATTKRKRKLKVGDIVLASSAAGDSIPHTHVRLLKKIVVQPTPGKMVGFRKTMDWPGYSGWETVAVYQDEIDELRKKWGIPYGKVGDDIIFVYDDCIIKKVKINHQKCEQSHKNSKIHSKVNNNGKK
jgi:hypothetical protein